jgi:predicted kinase
VVPNPQMEALIFVGVQGSGKTSFYRDRFFDSHVRISLDLLRTRQREQLLLGACLQGKQSFVVDNTNPLPSDRSRYIGLARASGFRVVAYFFETTLQDAIRRNNQRAGKHRIPVPGVAGTFRKLLRPKLEEGFDEIYTVRISPENGFVVERESLPPAER